MICHLVKVVVFVLVWHKVLPQYIHMHGYKTAYYAVVNHHEPGIKCMEKQYNDVKYITSFSAGCSDLLFEECALTVFQSTLEPFYVLGTKAPKDLETFAKNAKTTLNEQTLVPFGNWGKVSNQALEAYNRLMNAGLKNYLHELWAEACDQSLQFRSHSLACCVDQMIGVYLSKKKMWPPEQLWFMAGGCPRCGDQDFAANVDKAFAYRYRFNFRDDSIPAYPNNTCAKNTNAKSGTGTDCWFHCCENPVRYTSYLLKGATYNFEKCTTAEDTKCHSGTDPSWHTKYFQVKTADWTTMSCPLGEKYIEVAIL